MSNTENDNPIPGLQAQRDEINAQIAAASLAYMQAAQDVLAGEQMTAAIEALTTAAADLPAGERGARYVNAILLNFRTNARSFANELASLQVLAGGQTEA